MTDEAIQNGTGKPLSQWSDIINRAGLADAPHKKIADYLHDNEGISYWWAQSVTVEYEKSIGRRVHGQTQDGYFQLGVSRTLNARAGAVWALLNSPEGVELLFGATAGRELAGLEGTTEDGVRIETTTAQAGSHVRLQWQEAGWQTHSILQIRVMEKDENRCTISFHHEKLPSLEVRDEYRKRWRVAANRIQRETAEQ